MEVPNQPKRSKFIRDENEVENVFCGYVPQFSKSDKSKSTFDRIELSKNRDDKRYKLTRHY